MKITREMKALSESEPRLIHALKAAEILEDVMLYFYNRDYDFSWDETETEEAAAIKLDIDKKCDFLARTYLTSIYGLNETWGFVGEESFDNSERNKEYYWCIDPICGSLGYKKKTGNFGTSIALIHNGQAILGVMNCPIKRWTGAAILTPKPAVAYSPVAKVKKVAIPRIVVSANKKDNENQHAFIRKLSPANVTYAESLPVKSLGIFLGKFDLYYGLPAALGGGKFNVWDIGATMAFAKARGCFLTDAFGAPIRLDQKDHRYYNGLILTRDKALWRKAVKVTNKLVSRATPVHIVPAKITHKPSYFVTGLRCVICGREYKERRGLLTCPGCGNEGILDILYDYEAIGQVFTKDVLLRNLDSSHWRFLPLLPVKNGRKIPPLHIGGSPIYEVPRLAKMIGIKRLWIKDDGINPTASLKDRASSVGVARAMAQGAEAITCASTGNAASSLAGSAAAAGIPTFIFVPEKAPEAKVAQLLIFGANVFVVKGSYEDAFNLSMSCAKEFGFYNRNSGINPYLVEGKKTVSLEMCEQLNWSVPDYVFVAVGDGCTIAGVWKGFVEMKKLGFTKRLPRLVGVQASGASPIVTAWKSGGEMKPVVPRTLADSIAVGTPRNWRKAVRAVKESNGFYISVSDAEILSAMKRLGNICGVFGEPAGVTGLAGIIKAVRRRQIPQKAGVATIVSGNGLKDTASAVRAAGKARHIQPDTTSLKPLICKILNREKVQ